MKKIIYFFLLLIFILLFQKNVVRAESTNNELDFSNIFDEHGVVMLIIDSDTGAISYANNAAAKFYGYTKEQLLSMKIAQINSLSEEEINKEMQAASNEHRNYFIFKHFLANGETRTVEVYSYPVTYTNKEALFSIIYDITDKSMLETKEKRMTLIIFISGFIIILILLIVLRLIKKNNTKLLNYAQEIENFNKLRQTFINANESFIYLKDENLNYIFINDKLENFYHVSSGQIIGKDDGVIENVEFTSILKESDVNVIKYNKQIKEEILCNDKIYQVNKFPVLMLNGNYGVGAYIEDITKLHEQKKLKEIVLKRHMILSDMLTQNFIDKQEQLDYVLNQALSLTESKFGYIYLYSEEHQEFTLNSWSKGVMKECDVVDKLTVYQLEHTGFWGEVVRQRKPILVNDFEQDNPLKKGYPTGHVKLTNFMSIPVFIDDKIVAVAGVANAPTDYEQNDIYELTLLMNGVWNAIERRDAQENLMLEKNKYYQTLIAIGDGVLVVDKQGKVKMLNTVAQRLTGWTDEEAYGVDYKEVFMLSNEIEHMDIKDPIERVFITDTIQELGNHAMLTSKNGIKYNIEDSASPIKDDNNVTTGVVLVFRDVTEKKNQGKKIEYLSYHDSLTNLYNRRFFETELSRLDMESNLPMSIIIGDVNGLKLMNDIYGHQFGDELLIKVADGLKKVCRESDIIARWGGDEYVILLPKTTLEQSSKIIKSIKQELNHYRVKDIDISISLGTATKRCNSEDMAEILRLAEERMYSIKTLERKDYQKNVIETIIKTLHSISQNEKEHSERVSRMCAKFGKALNISRIDLDKLHNASFLHDIGKVVIDHRIIDKKSLNSQEQLEMEKHVMAGYRILNLLDEYADIADLVLCHHEHWNGSGYPKGLKGNEIPLLSRIIAIVEMYDKLMSNLNKSEVIIELEKSAGTSLDPILTQSFISNLVILD